MIWNGVNHIDDLIIFLSLGITYMPDVEKIRKWASSQEVSTREKAALNPEAPPEILERLAEDEEWWIRACVCKNENAPVHVLRKLSKDPRPEVRSWASANEQTPHGALERLAEEGTYHTLLMLAGNGAAPPRVVKRLVADPNNDVRDTASEHPNLPEGLLELMRRAGRDADLTNRPSEEGGEPLSESERERLMEAGPFGQRLVALNPSTPPDVLGRLAENAHWYGRVGVAKSTMTPEETVRKLATDDDYEVRWTVASRPDAPKEVLSQLAEDEKRRVRSAASENMG